MSETSASPDEEPLPKRERWRHFFRFGASRVHRVPVLQIVVYYVLLVGVAAFAIEWIPVVRRAFVSSAELPALAQGRALLTGAPAPRVGPDVAGSGGPLERGLTTLLIIVGAVSLAVPVAWVYMFVKRLRYDAALVRSVIILPIVVAGVTLIVRDSVALAFGLAGIVAAVRFRNTLKDPRDAVYIFLVIAIGLSAGVQALDVALVVSLAFNLVVLLLWKFNFGSVYGGRYGRTGVLSVGAPELLLAQTPERRRAIRREMLPEAEKMKTDGILLVHSNEPELARHTVQEAFGEMTRDWRLTEIRPRGEQGSTLEYLVRLKKKSTPAELVGALDERWSTQVAAAEYIPLLTRKKKRAE